MFLFRLIVSGGSLQIIGNDKISQDIILFAIIEVLLYFVTPLSYEETRCLLKGRVSFGQSLTLYGYKCLYINIEISQVTSLNIKYFMFVVRRTLFLQTLIFSLEYVIGPLVLVYLLETDSMKFYKGLYNFSLTSNCYSIKIFFTIL